MRRIRALRDRRGGTLAGESVWGLLIELVTVLGSLLSFTLLGRTLGPAGYGGYASLYAIVAPLLTLASAGVTLALLQHVVRDSEPLEPAARSCLTLTLGLGSLLTIGGSIAAALIIDTLSLLAMVSILVTEFVAIPIVMVAAASVQASDGFAASARIRLVALVSRIVVLVTLAVAGALTVQNLGLSMLAVATFIGILALVAVGRRYGFRFVPGAVRWAHLRSNLAYSGGITADAMGNDGDKLVLAANGLTVETGLYSAAYRIVQFGGIPVAAVAQAAHNRFLEHEDGVKRQHLARAVRFGWISLVYGVLFALLLVAVAPLLPIILGEEFEGSVEIVRWLSPIVGLRALGICSINALMGLGKVAMRTVLLSVNAAMALGLYIWLVPMWGWKGAAVGTLIGEVASVAMTWGALVHYQRKADAAVDAAMAATPSGPGSGREVPAPEH